MTKRLLVANRGEIAVRIMATASVLGIIATPEASLGMGGSAMIEGGGLGVVGPDDVGGRRPAHRAGLRGGAAQGLRPRRDGDDRR
jgi:hypothetical protein